MKVDPMIPEALLPAFIKESEITPNGKDALQFPFPLDLRQEKEYRLLSKMEGNK